MSEIYFDAKQQASALFCRDRGMCMEAIQNPKVYVSVVAEFQENGSLMYIVKGYMRIDTRLVITTKKVSPAGSLCEGLSTKYTSVL